jgi:hypothetical protein
MAAQWIDALSGHPAEWPRFALDFEKKLFERIP